MPDKIEIRVPDEAKRLLVAWLRFGGKGKVQWLALTVLAAVTLAFVARHLGMDPAAGGALGGAGGILGIVGHILQDALTVEKAKG